jgi:hypothetical protein
VKRALLVAAALFCACSSNEKSPADQGVDQPIRVRAARAQFFPGDIPHDQGGPKIVTVDSPNNRVRAGFVNKSLSGNASKGASSIGLRFADLGSGYWTVGAGDLDPITDGEIQWGVAFDVAPDVPIGKHPLSIVAFDADGNAGPVFTQDFEITDPIPKGHVVISLEWNSPADLDLIVKTPQGKRVDPKHPTTGIVSDGGVDTNDPSIGQLDRDSNANCVRDGYDREDLVFTGAPPPGLYEIGATMTAGCGATSATYRAVVYVDGKEVASQSGRFLEQYDVTGGYSPSSDPKAFTTVLKIEL